MREKAKVPCEEKIYELMPARDEVVCRHVTFGMVKLTMHVAGVKNLQQYLI